MKRLIIIYLLLLNLAYSCTNQGNTTDNPAKLLGQKLTLPKDIATRYIGDKDTVVRSSNIKLVTYYTESDCTSCSLKQLSNWQYYLQDNSKTRSCSLISTRRSKLPKGDTFRSTKCQQTISELPTLC